MAEPVPTDQRAALAKIKTFTQLVAYLRDELGWPINGGNFEDLTFEYTPEELGIDPKNAAKIEEIRRLRPGSANQPWGIFFIKFEPKRLPVVALRRILGQVVLKKRATAKAAERVAWAVDDLLFVSNYGEKDERQISFAHFSSAEARQDLPTLKVLGWDNRDTALHLDSVARELTQHLAWPENDADVNGWREQWRTAFTLRHREVVTTSKELSIRLAEFARAIRDRIKAALAIETETGPLKKLMKAFQQALVHDLDADGFADMYAQTIAYGLLSARITDPRKKTVDDFAAHMRTNPFLKELMQTFLHVGGRRGRAGGPGIDFDELGVSEVTDLLDDANMEAVVRDFGDRNREEDPVIHFYELFLTEYDRQTKIQRGVFYTPQPVVSYIVRSVHELLQTEFGLADGLADTTTWGEMLKKHPGLKLPPLTDEPGEKRTIPPDELFVQILDPATGTATFLVEVIDVIHGTLIAKWKQQRLTGAQQSVAWNDYVPKHLLPRLHAFELMMAPYAIAHMKIGLKLAETGYRFGTEERARIYLTNALEPWVKQLPLIGFDALAHEAAAVNEIKRHKRFTVVIGNPPYAGHSSNTGEWISNILNDYYFVDGMPLRERNSKWLQDDYVKFVRFAQLCVVSSHLGILGFITNNGYLDNPTFRGMRYNLMRAFETIRVLDLHGNSKKRERSLDGGKDENVFDITQGVAILLATQNRGGTSLGSVENVSFLGLRKEKYSALNQNSVSKTSWGPLKPTSPFYLFVPQDVELRAEYEAGFKVTEAMPTNNTGMVSKRDGLAFQHDKQAVLPIVQDIHDLKESEIVEKYPLSSWTSRDGKPEFVKRSITQFGVEKSRVVQALYRPFDLRWTYYTPKSKGFIAWPVYDIMRHLLARQNVALILPRRVETAGAWHHVLAADHIIDHVVLSLKTIDSLFPLYLHPDGEDALNLHGKDPRPNFAPAFLKAVSTTLKVPQQGTHGLPAGLMPEDIFHYAYAVFHSPGYRSRYAEFLKIDFPRLPLTGSLELFRALARLGGELTALHLLESPKLARSITEFIGGGNPEVEKISWSKNTAWVNKAQTAGFKGVREDVWSFHIGGYQVCEKWLKDRKGRTLSKDDIAHYQKIVVALSETIRLMKEIDEVIDKHGGWPGAFRTGIKADGPACPPAVAL